MIDLLEQIIIKVKKARKKLELRTVFHSDYLTTDSILEIMDRLSVIEVKDYGIIYYTDEARTVGNVKGSEPSKLNIEKVKEVAESLNINLRLYRYE